MAYVVVITFDNEVEAGKARETLRNAQKQGYLDLVDAVTVVKHADGKIKVKDELDKGVAIGTIGGGFLGLLISGIFFPMIGLVLGAIGGGVIGKMAGMGIDKPFTREVSESLQPGGSALFLVLQPEYVDYVIAALEPYQGQIYHTSIPEDAEAELRKALDYRVGSLDNQMIALGFEGEATAAEVLNNILDWQEHGILKLEDAVIASRGYGAQVDIRQTKTMTGKYALKGSGIGLLAGILLGGPVGGLVVGAAAGAVAGKRKDIGIDDHIIKQVSDELRPDTSMLFLLGKAQDPKRLSDALSTLDAVVVTSTLTGQQQENLMRLLGGETAEEAAE